MKENIPAEHKKDQPSGELVIRTLAMPADTNANGDIFGGWLMSQMDLGAAILAKTIAQGRVATVVVENIKFLLPVRVGDTVACYARLLNVGRTSMQIAVEVWIKSDMDKQELRVAEGLFIYVAIDDMGRTRPVPTDND